MPPKVLCLWQLRGPGLPPGAGADGIGHRNFTRGIRVTCQGQELGSLVRGSTEGQALGLCIAAMQTNMGRSLASTAPRCHIGLRRSLRPPGRPQDATHPHNRHPWRRPRSACPRPNHGRPTQPPPHQGGPSQALLPQAKRLQLFAAGPPSLRRLSRVPSPPTPGQVANRGPRTQHPLPPNSHPQRQGHDT